MPAHPRDGTTASRQVVAITATLRKQWHPTCAVPYSDVFSDKRIDSARGRAGGCYSRYVAATRRPGYQPLVVVLAAVCAGILFDRYLPARLIFWWLLAGGLWSVWLVAWLNCREAPVIFHCCCAWPRPVLPGTRPAGRSSPSTIWAAFATEAAQPVCIEAVVRRGPRRIPAPQFDPLRPITASERTRLALRVTGLRNADRWEVASGSVTLDVDGHLLSVAAGDRLRIFGQLRAREAQ